MRCGRPGSADEVVFLSVLSSDKRPAAAHSHQPPQPIRLFMAAGQSLEAGWWEEELQEGGAGGYIKAPGPTASRTRRGTGEKGLNSASLPEAPQAQRWRPSLPRPGRDLKKDEDGGWVRFFLPSLPNTLPRDLSSWAGHPAPLVHPACSAHRTVGTSRKTPWVGQGTAGAPRLVSPL